MRNLLRVRGYYLIEFLLTFIARAAAGHEPEARGGGDREEGVQRAAPEGEPDRLHHGVHRGGQDEHGPGVGRDGVAPVSVAHSANSGAFAKCVRCSFVF